MFFDNIIDKIIEIDNYVLFSITMIKIKEESKIIGYGAFNYIYLTKELRDKLKDLQ